MSATTLSIRNGRAAPIAGVPVLAEGAFLAHVSEAIQRGARLVALLARDPDRAATVLYAVLAERGALEMLACQVEGRYASLTPACPQAHLFEREIAEQSGIVPAGHPWLKPVRGPRASGAEGAGFFQMAGGETHEVAVGPVHAGIIEPGHFRFQCHGETIHHLEIALGYQHRGVEAALRGGPTARTTAIVETLAGDTTVGHTLAYAQAVEALAGTEPAPRAQVLRGIALELERLANHVGDLGALAGDVGYLPTASFCGRLRGEILGLTALVCGSRLGRGWIRPGGVGFDLEGERVEELRARLARAMRDIEDAVSLLWETGSVRDRFEGTGRLTAALAVELGLVGPVARACGVARDVRTEFPSGIYRFAQVPLSTAAGGDVLARAYVRWLEIERSANFVSESLGGLPADTPALPLGALAPAHCVVSLVEGWRGEVCHVAFTDVTGRFARYKAIDPSFHNWIGLALAMRGGQISDFPLCNKSFNLSYCGHDL